MRPRFRRLLPALAILMLIVNMTPGYVPLAYADEVVRETDSFPEPVFFSAWELEKRVYGLASSVTDVRQSVVGMDVASGSEMETQYSSGSMLPGWFDPHPTRMMVPSYVSHFEVVPSSDSSTMLPPAFDSADGEIASLPDWYVPEGIEAEGGDAQKGSTLWEDRDSLLPIWFAMDSPSRDAETGDVAATVSSSGVTVYGPAEVHNC